LIDKQASIPREQAAHLLVKDIEVLVESLVLGDGLLVGGLDLVDTDEVVGPSRVEVGAGLVPGEGSAAEVLLGRDFIGLHGASADVLQELVAWQVENLDALLGTDDEPVEFLGEENAVDWGFAVAAGEPLALNEVPDHDLTVTGSGGEVAGAVDHVEGVDLGLVSGESVHEGHVQVVPDLDGLIPRGSHADGWLLGVVELNAGDGVSVLVLVNDVLALGSGVPDTDLSVSGTSDDLSVIWGEIDGHDRLGVTDELLDGLGLSDFPKSASAVPGGGQSVFGVTSELHLRDEVGVA